MSVDCSVQFNIYAFLLKYSLGVWFFKIIITRLQYQHKSRNKLLEKACTIGALPGVFLHQNHGQNSCRFIVVEYP